MKGFYYWSVGMDPKKLAQAATPAKLGSYLARKPYANQMSHMGHGAGGVGRHRGSARATADHEGGLITFPHAAVRFDPNSFDLARRHAALPGSTEPRPV